MENLLDTLDVGVSALMSVGLAVATVGPVVWFFLSLAGWADV